MSIQTISIDDDFFGNYVCTKCCVRGTIEPSSGWGDSSKQITTCRSCREKSNCHLISTNDLNKIKSEIRNQKISSLGL